MRKAARWRRSAALFQGALEGPPGGRTRFLERACEGDESLQREVLSLLLAHRDAEGFLGGRAPAKDASRTRASRSCCAPDEADPLAGRRLGAYRLLRRLAAGGMGAVYLAEPETAQPRRRVAVKVVRPDLASPELLELFGQERRILAALDHPNVVRLLDSGRSAKAGCGPFLVLEHVAGRHLDVHCGSFALGTPARLRLFQTVCRAVAFVHRRRIVHKDLKPSNVLVTAAGVPKLVDFGIAEQLGGGELQKAPAHAARHHRLMTPDYASPEQVRGRPAGPASDVYSLGAVLATLLTDLAPFPRRGGEAGALLHRACAGEPGLAELVLRALREDPARRYATAGELEETIGGYLARRSEAAR